MLRMICVFFFNDTATTEIYTLSLHDALPISEVKVKVPDNLTRYRVMAVSVAGGKQFGSGESNITARQPLMVRPSAPRSEEHTSELQSRQYLVCRLLLEKKQSFRSAAPSFYPN